ncbi:glycosyltransferase [Haloarculaceae archaeon H-GB2-1]|nr:glycosyltransferase [Haloarculaceae archaeon H-GB11]MEA5406499.1 glycosyltransferase [Haloarculaceae archaeon H-GB2-1]
MELADESPNHPWFDERDPVIVSVGRFSDQKDFETLVRAFGTVRERTDAKLVLVGDGPNRERLERLTDSLGLADAVDFVGYRDNPYPYMAAGDLFVLSSHYEGLPNVLIEAIGVGTPTVATDCPSGPREILLDGDGGYLVPVDNPDALADAMTTAIAEPEDAAERLERAREALDRFTPPRAAKAYLDLAR